MIGQQKQSNLLSYPFVSQVPKNDEGQIVPIIGTNIETSSSNVVNQQQQFVSLIG
jgi:hypothetical protein